MRTQLLSALAGLCFASSAFAATTTWDVDTAHTTADFSVRHMMVSNVHGTFSGAKGSVSVDDKAAKNSTVAITFDVGTVNTGEPKRDGHLKSPDFFDAAKNPTLDFKSTAISGSKDKFKVVGDLTMHGETHPVTLQVNLTKEVKDMMGSQRRGFEATGKLSRKQWGLTWNKALESGGVVVSDDVALSINGELVQHSDAVPTDPRAPAAKPVPAPAK